VELEPENAVAADLAKFVIDERLNGLASGHLEDWTSDWSPLERIEIRNRLAAAVQSREVDIILRPPRPSRPLK